VDGSSGCLAVFRSFCLCCLFTTSRLQPPQHPLYIPHSTIIIILLITMLITRNRKVIWEEPRSHPHGRECHKVSIGYNGCPTFILKTALSSSTISTPSNTPIPRPTSLTTQTASRSSQPFFHPPHRPTNRQTQTDRQTDRQTNKQTDRPTDGLTLY